MRPDDPSNPTNSMNSSTVRKITHSGVKLPEPKGSFGLPTTPSFPSLFKKQVLESTINWTNLGGAKFQKNSGDKAKNKRKKPKSWFLDSGMKKLGIKEINLSLFPKTWKGKKLKLSSTLALSKKMKWKIMKQFTEALKIHSTINGKMESICSLRRAFYWKMMVNGKKLMRKMRTFNKVKNNSKKLQHQQRGKKLNVLEYTKSWG